MKTSLKNYAEHVLTTLCHGLKEKNNDIFQKWTLVCCKHCFSQPSTLRKM